MIDVHIEEVGGDRRHWEAQLMVLPNEAATFEIDEEIFRVRAVFHVLDTATGKHSIIIRVR